jgi:hypothetical protein
VRPSRSVSRRSTPPGKAAILSGPGKKQLRQTRKWSPDERSDIPRVISSDPQGIRPKADDVRSDHGFSSSLLSLRGVTPSRFMGGPCGTKTCTFSGACSRRAGVPPRRRFTGARSRRAGVPPRRRFTGACSRRAGMSPRRRFTGARSRCAGMRPDRRGCRTH